MAASSSATSSTDTLRIAVPAEYFVYVFLDVLTFQLELEFLWWDQVGGTKTNYWYRYRYRYRRYF